MNSKNLTVRQILDEFEISSEDEFLSKVKEWKIPTSGKGKFDREVIEKYFQKTENKPMIPLSSQSLIKKEEKVKLRFRYVWRRRFLSWRPCFSWTGTLRPISLNFFWCRGAFRVPFFGL